MLLLEVNYCIFCSVLSIYDHIESQVDLYMKDKQDESVALAS